MRDVIAAVLLLGLPLVSSAQTAPVPIKGILAAERFTLAEPYEEPVAQGSLKVSAGILLVLDVDPGAVIPTDALERVLYVGGAPVIPLNQGDQSGHLLVIVPSSTDAASAQYWFGAPALPEALTADKLKAEQSAANKAGIKPPGAAAIKKVERKAVDVRDQSALLRDVAAPLVDEFSPQDAPYAAQWRLPEQN
ncbi:MAG TPA: hypothetical protein VMF52_02290 [Steroidobacteraceae bacterium]|nr:hypothetical protein [Steroidobacteraceae bacterium]